MYIQKYSWLFLLTYKYLLDYKIIYKINKLQNKLQKFIRTSYVPDTCRGRKSEQDRCFLLKC